MTGKIRCLECGRWFRAIGRHLTQVHRITAREYRARHDLPASCKLAADDLRAAQSERTRRMIAEGVMHNDPRAASEAARTAGRGRRSSQDLARQAEIARRIPHQTIPEGGKRADGRDAARAREAQRRRRAGIRLRPAAVLTGDKLAEARRLWANLSIPREEVARRTGVTLATLYRRLGPRKRIAPRDGYRPDDWPPAHPE